MQTTEDLEEVWRDLAELIGSLPVDDRARYQGAVRLLLHDLRQSISIVHGSEALLRRSIPATADNLELLDGIRVANQRAIELVSGLAEHFDPQRNPPPKDLSKDG
jgi:hypothetical protein